MNKIAFIGAGKVGLSLGKYFLQKDNIINGYYSKKVESAKTAANFTDSKVYYNLEELIESNDLIFITTPDDQIYNVWNEILLYKSLINNKIFCHTSGSLSSDIFEYANTYNAYTYSTHPMYAFSDKFTSYRNLNTASFSIEGSKEKLTYMKKFLESLGNEVLLIDGEKKALYHLANVVSSNFVLGLISLSCKYMKDCGIDEDKALKALMPLIKNNINNIETNGIINSLTGPIERSDIGTIKKHLDAISDLDDLTLYKIISKELLNISNAKHPERNNKNILSEL
jgi:predicted short-subunit dehydrogenase-like oxidoreductase (DUF2520 family)